jgi:hypothetical protein
MKNWRLCLTSLSPLEIAPRDGATRPVQTCLQRVRVEIRLRRDRMEKNNSGRIVSDGDGKERKSRGEGPRRGGRGNAVAGRRLGEDAKCGDTAQNSWNSQLETLARNNLTTSTEITLIFLLPI